MPTDGTLKPKEGRWIAKPRKGTVASPLIFVAILSSQLPTWVNLFSGDKGFAIWATLGFMGVLLAVMLLVALRAMARNARTLAETEAMMDGNFGDQYPVEINVVVEGKSLGSDQGVLWFADGLMGFSGGATGFVLAPEDLSRGPQLVQGGSGLRRVPERALVLRNAPREAYVIVTPLKRTVAFRERLQVFLPGGSKSENARLARLLDPKPTPTGERQWPPLIPFREAGA